MREITLDGKTLRVRATPLALLFYRQEFGADLIVDLVSLQSVGKDLADFNSVLFLQLLWAMAKADAPAGFPPFEAWLGGLESFDFGDKDLIVAIIQEASDGFFRRSGKQFRERRP
jgi:hypothetical protein